MNKKWIIYIVLIVVAFVGKKNGTQQGNGN